MENHAIRQRLLASLELAHARSNLILYLIATPVMILTVVLTSGHPEFWPAAVVLGLVMLLPIAMFYGWRIISIFRKEEHYWFCRCVLSQPHPGALRYTMYYTVLLEDPEGRKFPARTHAIFYSRGFIGPTIEDFTNKTVTIAYNRETGMVVVIG